MEWKTTTGFGVEWSRLRITKISGGTRYPPSIWKELVNGCSCCLVCLGQPVPMVFCPGWVWPACRSLAQSQTLPQVFRHSERCSGLEYAVAGFFKPYMQRIRSLQHAEALQTKPRLVGTKKAQELRSQLSHTLKKTKVDMTNEPKPKRRNHRMQERCFNVETEEFLLTIPVLFSPYPVCRLWFSLDFAAGS